MSIAVEIGIPFSDPMADGATIQESSRVALENGATLDSILVAIEGLGRLDADLVVMSYLNPLLAYGYGSLLPRLAGVGVSALVVPDLPLEESEELASVSRENGIGLVQLVSPVTSQERLEALGRASEGFTYAVTMTGTTGGTLGAGPEVTAYLDRVRAASRPPVLAGFGVRTRRSGSGTRPALRWCDRGQRPGRNHVRRPGPRVVRGRVASMIATLSSVCTLGEKAAILRFIEGHGLRVHVGEAGTTTIVSIIGDPEPGIAESIGALSGVESVSLDAPRYPFVAREARAEPSTVKVGDVVIGGKGVAVIAGPCSVESEEQLLTIARSVAKEGAVLLRGGAFKPRTSPYSFQGLGEDGLEMLARAREETGLGVVSEVVAPEDISSMNRYVDMLQVGSRNMQNFRLLSAVGEQPTPVLLKRGLMSTIEEMLLAAEYIVGAGNPRVVLCERGIRSFETATRGTLDISAVPVLKERSHLPVIVDPSHAAGKRSLVPSLSAAGVAAGADGLLIEVHDRPEEALSDGPQSLTLDGFAETMETVAKIAAALDRPLLTL